jgi:hypothetical protein
LTATWRVDIVRFNTLSAPAIVEFCAIHKRRSKMPNRGTRKQLLRIKRLIAAVVVLVGTTSLAFSQTPSAAGTKKPKKYVATREIIRDANGQLRRPTVEETQALVDQINVLTNRSIEGLTVKQQQNGMKSVSLAGRFSGVVLGRANADGTTEVRCVMTLEEAVDFLGLEEDTTSQQ